MVLILVVLVLVVLVLVFVKPSRGSSLEPLPPIQTSWDNDGIDENALNNYEREALMELRIERASQRRRAQIDEAKTRFREQMSSSGLDEL